MKKRARLLAALLALIFVVTAFVGIVPASAAGDIRTYTNAAEIYTLVRDGYNGGTKGPISITKGTLIQGTSTRT